MKYKIICFGLFFIFSSVLLSQELKKNEKIDGYRKKISTMNLINGLYLTKPQIDNYLGILKEVKELKEEYQSRLESHNPELAIQFVKLYSEVSEGKGISKETEKSARDINEIEKSLKEEYIDKLCGLEEKLISILTENQLCIIEDFKPCLIPPKNLKDPARVGQAKGDASGVVDALERLRKAPDKRYEIAKKKFIDTYIDKFEEKISVLSPEEKEKEIKRVTTLINYAKSLSDIDFEMKKESIAKDLLIERNLEHKKRKHELGRAGKLLLDEEIIPVLEKRTMALK